MGISIHTPLAEAYKRPRCLSRRNTRRLYTRIPSNTPSPYSRPWSNTETLAFALSYNSPSIQIVGAIVGAGGAVGAVAYGASIYRHARAVGDVRRPDDVA